MADKHTHTDDCYPNPSEFVPPPADLRVALAEAFADRHNATTERDHLQAINADMLDALRELLEAAEPPERDTDESREEYAARVVPFEKAQRAAEAAIAKATGEE